MRAKKFYRYTFNRQFTVGNFIVDFISRKLNLVIEIDGYVHRLEEQILIDRRKDHFLHSIGLEVLRLIENEVRNDLPNAILKMEDYLPDEIRPILS